MLAVAVIGTVAACGGSDASQPAPMPSRTGTASPSSPASLVPSPTTPEQQVEAAVRTYYAAMDHALRTGDTSDFLAITTADCPCRDFAATVAQKWRPGRYPGAGASLQSVERISTSRHDATVDVQYRLNAYTEVDGDRVVERIPARVVPATVLLSGRADRWVVTKSIDRSASR